MSLENFGEVDLVVRLPGSPPRAALVIHDGGEIAEDAPREGALQKKLATYLSFVATGQFAQAYPQLNDCEPYVAVVCVRPPTQGMRQITGMRRSSDHPGVTLPVEVTSDADFKGKFR